MIYQRIATVLLSVILGVTGTFMLTSENADKDSIQQGIAKEIIRFHVIANSDSDEDQNLKLQVKDGISEYMGNLLKNADSIEETRDIITNNLSEIKRRAEAIIKEEGHNETVKAYLTTCYYPIKKYGDYVFPAGDYEALRIEIGKAQGKNWWCVLYPDLCFVEGTYAIIDEDNAKLLKKILTEEEFNAICIPKDGKIKVKFKLLETIKSLVE